MAARAGHIGITTENRVHRAGKGERKVAREFETVTRSRGNDGRWYAGEGTEDLEGA